VQARTPLCLEYTRARDLMGRPVIEDGLARVSAPRSARKHVRGIEQQRPLEAVSGVNDLGPHNNALHYNVTVNTHCAMYWASMWLTPPLKDADLARWLVDESLLFYFLQCGAPLYYGLRVGFLVCGLFFSAPCCCSVCMLIC